MRHDVYPARLIVRLIGRRVILRGCSGALHHVDLQPHPPPSPPLLMPPRKKVKIDHTQEGGPASTRRTTRASSKAATAVTTVEASNVQPPVLAATASVAPAVVKLRRGCLKEIPNFAVEIQLMVCMPKYLLRFRDIDI